MNRLFKSQKETIRLLPCTIWILKIISSITYSKTGTKWLFHKENSSNLDSILLLQLIGNPKSIANSTDGCMLLKQEPCIYQRPKSFSRITSLLFKTLKIPKTWNSRKYSETSWKTASTLSLESWESHLDWFVVLLQSFKKNAMSLMLIILGGSDSFLK